MAHTFAVPYAIQQRLEEQRNGWSACRNLNLLLHHYVPREVITNERAGGKGEWLMELAKRSRSQSSPLFDRDVHEAWLRRWKRLADNHQAIQFKARCAWRMVVGLGGRSPVETDLLVHPIYGIPYVPGSALKGLVRAYAHLEDLDDDESILGTQEQGGVVIFFDAVPDRPLLLDVDIMNPHYPKYYRDTQDTVPPSDDQDPNPVHFLAVAAPSVFHFAVAPRLTDGTSREKVEKAAMWLKEALRDYGIGAKTNAGYGRFDVP